MFRVVIRGSRQWKTTKKGEDLLCYIRDREKKSERDRETGKRTLDRDRKVNFNDIDLIIKRKWKER